MGDGSIKLPAEGHLGLLVKKMEYFLHAYSVGVSSSSALIMGIVFTARNIPIVLPLRVFKSKGERVRASVLVAGSIHLCFMAREEMDFYLGRWDGVYVLFQRG